MQGMNLICRLLWEP